MGPRTIATVKNPSLMRAAWLIPPLRQQRDQCQRVFFEALFVSRRHWSGNSPHLVAASAAAMSTLSLMLSVGEHQSLKLRIVYWLVPADRAIWADSTICEELLYCMI